MQLQRILEQSRAGQVPTISSNLCTGFCQPNRGLRKHWIQQVLHRGRLELVRSTLHTMLMEAVQDDITDHREGQAQDCEHVIVRL